MGRRDIDEAPVLKLRRPDGTGASFVLDTREFRDQVRQRERDGYVVEGERRRGDDRDRREREREAERRAQRRR